MLDGKKILEFKGTQHVAGELIAVDKVSLPDFPASKTLIFLDSSKHLEKLQKNENLKEILLVVSNKLFEQEKQKLLLLNHCIVSSENFDQTLCDISKVIYESKFSLLNDVHKVKEIKLFPQSNIHPSAFIGEEVEIGEGVTIMAGVHLIGKVKVGSGTVIFPNVTVYPFVNIGKECRIHSGTVLGADGFGYKFINGIHEKVWQSGGVHIGDNVEIGSNCSVDGGTFIPTSIGSGTKIDNLVQIAHNVQIGENCVMCGMSGAAGSCRIGDHSVLGGRSGVGPHCEIGKGVMVAGGALVNKSWPDGSKLGGFPATELKEWRRSIVKFQRSARE